MKKMTGLMLCLVCMACDGLGIQGQTKVCTGAAGGWVFELDAWHFNDGSVMTSCHVNTGFGEATDMFLWRRGQQGAEQEKCSVVVDADETASSGTWEFWSVLPVQATVQYRDPGSMFDQDIVSLVCRSE